MNILRHRFMRQLKKLRKSQGLSQEAIAIKAGLSREYIARLETGRQDPTLGTMGKLAKALKVRPAELME